MKNETKEYLKKNIRLGMIPESITNIDDSFYNETHEEVDKIIAYVYLNDRNCYENCKDTLKLLSLEGLWRGRAYAMLHLLKLLLNEVQEWNVLIV